MLASEELSRKSVSGPRKRSRIFSFHDGEDLNTPYRTPLTVFSDAPRKVRQSKDKKLPTEVISLARIEVLGPVRLIRTADPEGLKGSKTLTRWRVTR